MENITRQQQQENQGAAGHRRPIGKVSAFPRQRRALQTVEHENQTSRRIQPSRAAKLPLSDKENIAPASQAVTGAVTGSCGFEIFVDDEAAALSPKDKPEAVRPPLQELAHPRLKAVAEAAECSPMLIDSSDDEPVQEEQAPTRQPVHSCDEIVHRMSHHRWEIRVFLRMRELQRMPSIEALTLKQREVTPNMRTILVDWLVEVSEEYKLQRETLHLAVAYVDRFLAKASVQKSKLQLVGAAAMFIAAKYEEIYPPDVAEFVYITDDTYTKKQVLRMEQTLLQFLHFDVALVTSNCFLELYSSDLSIPDDVKHYAAYLMELALVNGDEFMSLPVSHITAACLLLARLCRDREPWPADHGSYTGYSNDELLDCTKNLYEVLVGAADAAQRAVFDKYKTGKYQTVALMPVPILNLS